MRLVALLFIICHLSFSASAQTQVEYWFDQDPGLGQGTLVTATPAADGTLQFGAPTGQLPSGHHKMGVRSYHLSADGTPHYGPTLLRDIFVQRPADDGNFSRIEYFWDTDPGYGHGTPLPFTPCSDELLNDLYVPTTGLTPGTHRLHIRAFGGRGWSPLLSRPVVVQRPADEGRIVRLEYFWDSDPGPGRGTPISITPDGELNLDNLQVSTEGLAPGPHLLGIRPYGGAGWGPTVRQRVTVQRGAMEIKLVEYFWDTDPGIGLATPLPVVAGKELTMENVILPTDQLAPGKHRLGVRANGGNSWSPTLYLDTYVPMRENDAQVLSGEYFWDDDPGYGLGTPIAIEPGREVSVESLGIGTENLTAGRHQLFVRYRGLMGWSPTLSGEVLVMPETKVLSAEYFWNDDPGFGLGTPVDMTPGQEVTLDALGISTTDVHGDALFFIRYRGPYGWSPTVGYRILVDAEGNYTLNALAATSIEDRNYQTLGDAVADFADRGVCNDITLNLPTTNTVYELDATTGEVLTQLQTVSEGLDHISTLREGKTIGFKATSASGNALSVSTTDEGLPTVLGFFMRTWLEQVALTINGTAYDFSSWARAPRYEELCADVETTPVAISAPAEGMSVSFTAQPHEGTTLTGFEASATSALPVMTISNSGARTDSIAYRVVLSDAEGTELSAYTYYIYVRPRVGSQTFTGMLPATDSSLDPGTVVLKWNAVPGAEGYRLTVTDTTAEPAAVVVDGIAIQATTYSLTAESGHRYEWQVVATGPCDELPSPLMSFSGRLLPDLCVTTITLPEAAEAGNTISVKATIVNQGEGATTEGSWTDRLYYVVNSDDFAQAVEAATLTHTGNLAAGASYQAVFSVQVPQTDEGQLRVFVVTDAAAKVLEADADNNRTLSATAATLQPFYMQAEDLAALRLLYARLGGGQWNGSRWNTASELIKPDNWSGVSFDTVGHVTAISLQGRGLSGSLSVGFAATLSQLRTLNLSRNTLTGDPAAFITSAAMPALTTLDLSYNQIDELSAPLPATVTSLNLSSQHRQYGNNSVLPGLDGLDTRVLHIGSGMTVSLPAVALYNHGAQTFATHPQLYVYSRNMQTRYGTLAWSATNETYSYQANGWQQTMDQDTEALLVVASGTVLANSVWPAQMHFTAGDANLNGLVDVNDVQRTLNYVLNQNNSTTFGLWAANTFAEDETQSLINIQDIVCTVNIVLVGEGIDLTLHNPQSTLHAPQSALHAPSMCSQLSMDGRVLTLDAAQDIAAIDVELAGVSASQLKLLLPARHWQMQARATERGVRLMLFSPTGQSLPEGTTQLLRLSTEGAWPLAAYGSDPEALPVAIGVDGGTTTSVRGTREGLSVDREGRSVDCEAIYDLQGRQVDSNAPLRKGVYIQNGNKVKR